MFIAAMNAYNSIMMRNNAAMSIMRNNNALTSMISSPSFMGGFGCNEASLGALNAMETRMQCENLTNSLMYRIAKAQEESAKKMLKENIERSFNIFA